IIFRAAQGRVGEGGIDLQAAVLRRVPRRSRLFRSGRGTFVSCVDHTEVPQRKRRQLAGRHSDSKLLISPLFQVPAGSRDPAVGDVERKRLRRPLIRATRLDTELVVEGWKRQGAAARSLRLDDYLGGLRGDAQGMRSRLVRRGGGKAESRQSKEGTVKFHLR